MRKISNIKNSIKHRVSIFCAKKIISNKEYRIGRLKTMSDNVIYWNSLENNLSHFDFEKEYCKKMQDVYEKRFKWYKDKYLKKKYSKVSNE